MINAYLQCRTLMRSLFPFWNLLSNYLQCPWWINRYNDLPQIRSHIISETVHDRGMLGITLKGAQKCYWMLTMLKSPAAPPGGQIFATLSSEIKKSSLYRKSRMINAEIGWSIRTSRVCHSRSACMKHLQRPLMHKPFHVSAQSTRKSHYVGNGV